jgi:hypothetical protein
VVRSVLSRIMSRMRWCWDVDRFGAMAVGATAYSGQGTSREGHCAVLHTVASPVRQLSEVSGVSGVGSGPCTNFAD